MATINEDGPSVLEDIVFCPWPGFAVRIPHTAVENHPFVFALVVLIVFCYFYWPSGTSPRKRKSSLNVHVDIEETDTRSIAQHSNNASSSHHVSSGEDCKFDDHYPSQERLTIASRPSFRIGDDQRNGYTDSDAIEEADFANPGAISHEDESNVLPDHHAGPRNSSLDSNLDKSRSPERNESVDTLQNQDGPQSENDTTNDEKSYHIHDENAEEENHSNLRRNRSAQLGEHDDFPDGVQELAYDHTKHHSSVGNVQEIPPKEAAIILLCYFWSVIRRQYFPITLLLGVIVVITLYIGPLIIPKSPKCVGVMQNYYKQQKPGIYDSFSDTPSPNSPLPTEKGSPELIQNNVDSKTPISPNKKASTETKETTNVPMMFMPWPGAVIRIPSRGLPWTIMIIPALYFCFRYFSKLKIDWSKWTNYRTKVFYILCVAFFILVAQQQLNPRNGVGIMDELLHLVSVSNDPSDAEVGLCNFAPQRDSKLPEEVYSSHDGQPFIPLSSPEVSSSHYNQPSPIQQLPDQVQSPQNDQPPPTQPTSDILSSNSGHPSTWHQQSTPNGQSPPTQQHRYYQSPPIQRPNLVSSQNGQPPPTQPPPEEQSSQDTRSLPTQQRRYYQSPPIQRKMVNLLQHNYLLKSHHDHHRILDLPQHNNVTIINLRRHNYP